VIIPIKTIADSTSANHGVAVGTASDGLGGLITTPGLASVAGSHCYQDEQSEADEHDDADNHPAVPVEVLLLSSLRFGSD
jgi:hypothetical protein